jgi:hypothetical protein
LLFLSNPDIVAKEVRVRENLQARKTGTICLREGTITQNTE